MLTQCAHIVVLLPIRGRVAQTNCGSSLSDKFATIIRLQFVGSVEFLRRGSLELDFIAKLDLYFQGYYFYISIPAATVKSVPRKQKTFPQIYQWLNFVAMSPI